MAVKEMDSLREQVGVDLSELQRLARCIVATTGELTPQMLLWGNNDLVFLRAIQDLVEAEADTVQRLLQNVAQHFLSAREPLAPPQGGK